MWKSSEPHQFSLYAVYECTSEAQVNGSWEFHYKGMEGPSGEKLIAAMPDPVTGREDSAGGLGERAQSEPKAMLRQQRKGAKPEV